MRSQLNIAIVDFQSFVNPDYYFFSPVLISYIHLFFFI